MSKIDVSFNRKINMLSEGFDEIDELFIRGMGHKLAIANT